MIQAKLPHQAQGKGSSPKRVEVRPEDVFQPDRRPLSGASFDSVVAEVIAISSAAVGLVVLMTLLALWAG